METGCSKNGETRPQLLDLIPQERRWQYVMRDGEYEKRRHGSSEEKKLELRLGPPGEDSWSNIKHGERDESVLSLGYFSSAHNNGKHSVFHQTQTKPPTTPPFLQFPSKAMESSQPSCTKGVDLQKQNAEIKAFSQHTPANTAVPIPLPSNTSQKRTAPGPVVGWPPIRSFRKNLASSSSSKLASESPPHKAANEKAAAEPIPTSKGLFVKVNMDGIPIGRKVDLKAYDSYEKLSTAVDQLFRGLRAGLLAAQRDSPAGGTVNKQEEEKVITGVLDGSGEYKLVYEDMEGDRMLVGDVPWHMFVSTVKRLRVLKSSDVSALSLGSSKLQGKTPA